MSGDWKGLQWSRSYFGEKRTCFWKSLQYVPNVFDLCKYFRFLFSIDFICDIWFQTNNIGMSPIHHCNGLFLAKANELCHPDENCQRDAKSSLRFLLDINRSLQADTSTQEQCESHCPNMETLSELFDLR